MRPPTRKIVQTIAILVASGCFASHESDEDGPPEDSCTEDAYFCCDPDDCPCECSGYWHCTDWEGGRHCVQQNPDLPDDGGYGPWSCWYQGELIVCSGDAADHPDAGQDGWWDCIELGLAIECEREADEGDFPDDESTWECSFAADAESRACDTVTDPTSEWDCELLEDGRRRCTNRDPEMPDGGRWSCYRQDGIDVCVGDHLPDDGEVAIDWACQVKVDLVVCESDRGQVPDDTTAWDCSWGSEMLVCEEPIREEPTQDDCCPEETRYCEEPMFSDWGLQTCEWNDGQPRWGNCHEAEIPDGCEPGGEHARDYEWHYAGGYWDGQVNDPDGDGMIVMPPDFWFNPAGEDCAIRIGLCVQDMWDLDNDGDNQESAGDCLLKCI